jgi:uncharacterized membrane protein
MAIPQPRETGERQSGRHVRQGRPIGNVGNGPTRLDELLARALGWFSIGIGLAESIAPGRIASVAGAPRRGGLIRLFGMREMTAGVGLLADRRPTTWMWSRVAGDVLDLAALLLAFSSPRARRRRLIAATVAVAGVTAVDVLCARRLSRDTGRATTDTPGGVRVRTAITINRSPDDVYRYWRDFANLARVMRHVESVRLQDERRSHWVARGPRGARVEWNAEIVEDRPGELIAWRSLPGGDVRTEGTVRFQRGPSGRGTEVHLDMTYDMPGGLLGAAVGGLFGGRAAALAADDLRPLKQVLETGEVPSR